MTIRSQTTPIPSGDGDDSPGDAVVWPDPSPLNDWWQQVMQPPSDSQIQPDTA